MAYIVIKFANSPRAGRWVLERSLDGEHFTPWQYFANHPSECERLFGTAPLGSQAGFEIYFSKTDSDSRKFLMISNPFRRTFWIWMTRYAARRTSPKSHPSKMAKLSCPSSKDAQAPPTSGPPLPFKLGQRPGSQFLNIISIYHLLTLFSDLDVNLVLLF